MENLSLLNIALIVFSLCLFGLVAWTGARNFDLQIDADIANGKISLLEQSVKRHQDARNKNVLRLFVVRDDLMRAVNCAHEHAILEENLYARLHSAQMELREARRQLGESAGKIILLNADLLSALQARERDAQRLRTAGEEVLSLRVALQRAQKDYVDVKEPCADCEIVDVTGADTRLHTEN